MKSGARSVWSAISDNTASRLRMRHGVSRPPRIAGFDYNGPYLFLVTCCTHLRRPLFVQDVIVSQTLEQFRRTAVEDRFSILAYCVMPDHAHFLVEGLVGDSDLRRFVRVAKQRSAYEYSRSANGDHLWQDGYHDRVLRKEDDLRATARYVVQNPVRAGLVSSAADYKHSGSDVWTMAEILEG